MLKFVGERTPNQIKELSSIQKDNIFAVKLGRGPSLPSLR